MNGLKWVYDWIVIINLSLCVGRLYRDCIWRKCLNLMVIVMSDITITE